MFLAERKGDLAMDTIEYILPIDFASALINGDYSGLDHQDVNALDRFLKDISNEFDAVMVCIDVEESDSDGSEGFLKYHDLQPYGILAAPCSKYTFSIHTK